MASKGYQMTGALADVHGGIVEVGHNGPVVEVRPHSPGVICLDAAKRDEWQRLYMEAERQAEEWAKEHGEAGVPVHLPSGGERVESAVHRLLGLPEEF